MLFADKRYGSRFLAVASAYKSLYCSSSGELVAIPNYHVALLDSLAFDTGPQLTVSCKRMIQIQTVLNMQIEKFPHRALAFSSDIVLWLWPDLVWYASLIAILVNY